MRQAPIHYLVIGNGRLATFMLHYLSESKLKATHWFRQKNQTLEKNASLATHALILIKDDAIKSFLKEHPCLDKKICVHFSGALSLENCYSAHPLQTFTENSQHLHQHAKHIPFIIEEDGPEFSYILPGLSNPHYRLKRKDKPYYHALCVMANNISTLLWQHFFHTIKHDLDIPYQAAIPFLEQTLTHLKYNYKTALTGPFKRHDKETLAHNAKALKARQDPYAKLFLTLIDQFNKGALPHVATQTHQKKT